MAGICTDFGAILTFFPAGETDSAKVFRRQGLWEVARMEFQLATTANLLSLCLLRESFRVLCLGWPGSGFIKLVRETLSKSEVLPGLTYFYCNWVSQGGNVVRAPSHPPLVRAFLCPALQPAGSGKNLRADSLCHSATSGGGTIR